MNDQVAYPRPAPLEERIARRGCRNCIFYDSQGQQCRQGAPRSSGPADWCGQWSWVKNSRVKWDSAFAGLEIRGELS